MKWHSKNLCNPQDPEYDQDYDADADYDDYDEACIEREEFKHENYD